LTLSTQGRFEGSDADSGGDKVVRSITCPDWEGSHVVVLEEEELKVRWVGDHSLAGLMEGSN
jgi:hypothetical protein